MCRRPRPLPLFLLYFLIIPFLASSASETRTEQCGNATLTMDCNDPSEPNRQKFYFELDITNGFQQVTFDTGNNNGTCSPVEARSGNKYILKADFINCSKTIEEDHHSINFTSVIRVSNPASNSIHNNLSIVVDPCDCLIFKCSLLNKADAMIGVNVVCNKTCSGRGNCTIQDSGTFGLTPGCACETGFSGNDCEIDACSFDPCNINTTGRVCSLKPANVSEYECKCPPGYSNNVTANKCEDNNECNNPVHNICNGVYTCANQNGGYSCESTNSTCVFAYQSGNGALTCSCNSGYEPSAGQANDINTFACVDKNECLVNNGGCPTNATCTNTIGSRQCTCDSGFHPPYSAAHGTGCEEDACNPNPCYNNGSCVRTLQAPHYFKCNCVGYGYGPTCKNYKPLLLDTSFCNLTESDVRVNLTDYGESPHDCTEKCCVLEGSSAQTIKINFVNYFQVVPFFESVAYQIKMHHYGVLTLNEEPQILSQIRYINGDQSLSESLMPLWGDHEMRSYSKLKIRQFHSSVPIGNFEELWNHVLGIFDKLISLLSSDKTTWTVVVAEWDHVYPLPSCAESISMEAIIVSDGHVTLVAYNDYAVDIPYACTEILNGIVPMMEIGYYVIDNFESFLNPDGSEFAYHLSLEDLPGGHGFAGLQVFNTYSNDMSSDQLLILNWALQERLNGDGNTCRKTEFDSSQSLLHCPCSVDIAADGTVIDDIKGFKVEDPKNWIINSYKSVSITQTTLDGATIERECSRSCEYTVDGTRNTAFQTKNFIRCRDVEISSVDDYNIFDLCLNDFYLCYEQGLFSDCRPSYDQCQTADQVAKGFGDPHFNTLDGKGYTFNGLGDYTLTQFENDQKRCAVHSRTSQAINSDTNTPTAATFFSGFSAGCSDSARFRVLMISNGMDLQICTGTQCISSDLFQRNVTYTEISRTANFVVTKKSSKEVEIQLGSNADLILTVIYNDQRFLTPNVRIGRNYSGNVRGLLGNMDGDATNDFIPNGKNISLPSSSSEQKIYTEFGETWKLQNDLIFDPRVVPSGFTPVFSDNLDWTNHPVGLAAAQATCGNDNSCLFDVHQTASTAFGAATKQAFETLVATRAADANTPPTITSSVGAILNRKLGDVITFTITAITTSSFPVTSRAENLPQAATYNSTTGAFQWTVVHDPAFNGLVKFVATTNPGRTTPPLEKISALTMTFVICDCVNGGKCVYERTRTNATTKARFATCDCPPNWEGLSCETDLNGCALNPCKSDGTGCEDVVAAQDTGVHHNCTACPPDYFLRPSSVPTLLKCVSKRRCPTSKWGVNCTKDCKCIRGNCDSDRGCVCPSGFTGIFCEININECLDPTTCHNNATCTDTPGSFTCICNTGFSGNGTFCEDINECTSLNPCDINADCLNTIGSFTCTCRAPFNGNGRVCATLPVDECALTPSPCAAKSTCFDFAVGFNCTCNTGYEGNGQVSCNDIDECKASPCQANANCTNTEGSYTCTCYDGFAKDVSNPGECIPTHCSPACDVNAQCKDNTTCICLPGFEGTGLQCTNINECLKTPKPCGLNAECIDSPGSFSCVCPTMYEGDPKVRCIGIDVCQRNDPCVNSACISTNPPLYECRCYQGYERLGKDSCNDINECDKRIDNCDNSTTRCTNTEGGFTCPCKQGYKGGITNTYCVLVDQTVTCDNTLAKPCPKTEVARCLAQGKVFTCQCDQGFEKINEMCFSKEGIQCGMKIANRNVARASNPTATPQEVTNALKKIYQDLSGYKDIIITSFLGGSINVEYLVKIMNPITPGEFRRIALFLRNKLNGTNNILENIYQIDPNSYFVRNPQNFSDIILVENLLAQKCLAFVCQNGGSCVEAAATGEPTCECSDQYEGEYCEKVKEIEEGLSDAVIAIIVVVVIIAFFLIVIAIVAVIVTLRKKDKYSTWVSGDAPIMIHSDDLDTGYSAFRRSQLYFDSSGGYDNFATYESDTKSKEPSDA